MYSAHFEARQLKLVTFLVSLLPYPSTRHIQLVIFISLSYCAQPMTWLQVDSTFELNQVPRTCVKNFTSALTLARPTIITYVDDGLLESLTIYNSLTSLLAIVTCSDAILNLELISPLKVTI